MKLKTLFFLGLMFTLSTLTAQKKNQYAFGYGINTIDPLNSQVFFLDYSRLLNDNWSYGFVYQHTSSNFTRLIVRSFDTIHAYYRRHEFTHSELLTENEIEVGTIKMNGISQYFRDNLWAPYICYGWKKKKLIYSFSLGFGVIEYSIKGQGLTAKSIIDNDSTKEAWIIVPYIVRGLSAAVYADFRFLYQFDTGVLIGTKVSFNYDLIDGGGFPLQNTLFMAVKF